MRAPSPLAKLGIAALILAAALPGSIRAQDAAPRTISNVATLSWDGAAGRVARPSNRVDIAVERATITTTPTTGATTYRIDANAAMRAPLAGTRCGESPVAWGPAYAGVSIDAAGLAPTNAFRVGEPLIATIDHPAGNRDRGVSDTLEVELRNGADDAERLTLMETGPDTGRFAGAIPTRGGAAVVNDCRLTVRAGATTALSFHLADGATLATASVSYLIDPFGIVFDSATGSPCRACACRWWTRRRGGPPPCSATTACPPTRPP